MTPCGNATASTASSRDKAKNDNSNPQQGTGLSGSSPFTMEAPPPAADNKVGFVGPNYRTNQMRSPPNKQDSRKLFVGGLPADVTSEEFKVFFEQFGVIVDSVVMFDRETQRSRGFGFVTFQSAEVANGLLNMGQSEDESGDAKADQSRKTGRVGRLVMRGKTCEVKAAEPKFSRSQNRRPYQNQGGTSAAGPAGPVRRFVEKAYPQPNTHASHGPVVPHATPFHDHHYMVANHYPMVSPSYYPPYHPAMYHGAAGYHPAPMYAPVGGPVAPPVPVQGHSENPHHPYVAPLIATPVEGAHAAPYIEAVVAAQEQGYAYPPAGYGHPQMMPEAYHPPHPAMLPRPPTAAHAHPSPAYPAPGTPASAMHPAAPGLPTKDE